jgi:Cof subfamily protein (haloacid dehalogenase superfamily)
MDKVQGLFADMKEREQAWQELKRFDSLELVGSLKYNIEINAAGVNKGKGLLELGEILGISREEIMAFGDGDNDIAMLREVGFGVAMENADEEVKAVSDYVTGSNDEDGVAKAIARFVLGETVQ